MEATLNNPEGPPVDSGGEEMGQLLLEQAGSFPNLQGQKSPNIRWEWAHYRNDKTEAQR